jgi:hypothetical protein
MVLSMNEDNELHMHGVDPVESICSNMQADNLKLQAESMPRIVMTRHDAYYRNQSQVG